MTTTMTTTGRRQRGSDGCEERAEGENEKLTHTLGWEPSCACGGVLFFPFQGQLIHFTTDRSLIALHLLYLEAEIFPTRSIYATDQSKSSQSCIYYHAKTRFTLGNVCM